MTQKRSLGCITDSSSGSAAPGGVGDRRNAVDGGGYTGRHQLPLSDSWGLWSEALAGKSRMRRRFVDREESTEVSPACPPGPPNGPLMGSRPLPLQRRPPPRPPPRRELRAKLPPAGEPRTRLCKFLTSSACLRAPPLVTPAAATHHHHHATKRIVYLVVVQVARPLSMSPGHTNLPSILQPEPPGGARPREALAGRLFRSLFPSGSHHRVHPDDPE